MKISKVVKECDKVSGRNAAIGIAMKLLGLDGGEGSGNFGHAGRPGQVGGSASEEGSARSEGSLSKSEEIEKIKAEIPKLSRFGEQGKKRAELQKKLEELEGKNRKEAPTKHAGIPAKNPAVERIEPKNYPVTEHKQSQFEIIQKTNPMHDDIHTGIRSPSDIMSPEEALSHGDDNSFVYPDWSREDGKKALETGMVTLYSSYPIKNGVFVTPSKRMSTDYSGGKEPYSVTVPVSDVAWINSDEGQFARVTENKSKDDCFDKSFRFSDVIREFGRDRDKKETIRLAMRMLGLDIDALDGGPGSGNWGHKGRPGKRGGSGKGGGKAYRGGRSDIGYFSSKTDWLNAFSGEKQAEAVNFMKIASRFQKEGKTVEKSIMEMPNDEVFRGYKEKYIGLLEEARNWDRNSERLVENNLDEDDKKIIKALSEKYGELGTGLPDDHHKDQWSQEDLYCWYDLKSKALGGETSEREPPEDLQYAAGTKKGPRFSAETDPENADPEEVKKVYKEKQESIKELKVKISEEKQKIRNTFSREYIDRFYGDVKDTTLDEIQKEMDNLFPTYDDYQQAYKEKYKLLDDYYEAKRNDPQKAEAIWEKYEELSTKYDDYQRLQTKSVKIERYEEMLGKIAYETEAEKMEALRKAEEPLTSAESSLSDYESRMKKNPEYLDKIYESDLRQTFERFNVKKIEPAKYGREMTEDDIIKRIGGGDRTSGSCASLALAYVGCKSGLDVLDFRGGESLNLFARKATGVNGTLVKMPELKKEVSQGPRDIDNAYGLLKKMENGKEYVLCTGKHCSVVRMTEDGKMQYLELQSATENGWTDFNGNPRYTLANRFGCWKTTEHGPSVMVEVSSMVSHPEIIKLLPYLNTAEAEQKKGAGGFAK